MRAADAQGGRLAVLCLDLDRFKEVNDLFGHAAGDRVLQAVARALELSLREYDMCARWGGEEFLLLFPACESANAPLVAERLRLAVAAAPRISEEIPAPTISIGYTQHRPGENIDKTLLRADEALYKAKDSGRNCSVGM